jgi:hypothetical protein
MSGTAVERERQRGLNRLRSTVARIQERQSLYRLAFGTPRTTRTILYQQALAFEEWLAQLAEELDSDR